MSDSRREAIFVFARWLATSDFPDRLLSESPNHSFVQSVVYCAIRRKSSLGWVLRQLVKHMPKGEVEAALYIGAAQVLFMGDVPDHAAVHETVEAVKRSSRHAAGMVNAVLRALVRQREEVLAKLNAQDLPLRYSHPAVCVKRWRKQFGDEQCEALCAWNNLPAQTCIVPIAALAESPDLTPRELNGVRYFVLRHGLRVTDIPGFAEGAFVVQDPATFGAIELLDVQSGQRVLDACAAPGGKTVAIAVRNPDGEIVAMDCHEDRLVQLRDTLRRTHLERVRVEKVDVSKALPGDTRLFDRILLDVPCSNSGVFRRRPDARWRWSEKRLEKLVALQRDILDVAVARLAAGGRIVYSTCSLESEENELQVEAFLSRHPEFKCIQTRQVLPFQTQTDGAFAAALVRD